MEQDAMTLIPPVVLLASLVLIVWLLLRRLPADTLLAALKAEQLAVIVAVVLFSFILVTHLFVPQDWTADLLKVLIGAVLGSGAALAKSGSQRTESLSSVDTEGLTFGDHAKIAGRDINETIERLQSDVANIKDAVVNQYQTIAESLRPEDQRIVNDLLINTIYERQSEDIAGAVERVVARWHEEGWLLSEFTSDYEGMDGLFLVFSRPGQGRVSFYHGSNMSPAGGAV